MLYNCNNLQTIIWFQIFQAIIWFQVTNNHHHHLVMPSAWISLALSRHPSLSFIASSRSSGLHTVSSQSCCMYVRAGCSAFSQPCEGVHRSISLMSSSILLQQCPACLVRLTLIIFVMVVLCGVLPPGPVQYCSQHYCVVAVKLFSCHLVSVHVVHPYSSIDMIAAWKKLHFILLVRSDFHMTDNLLIAVDAFVSRMSMSVSVDETLVPR